MSRYTAVTPQDLKIMLATIGVDSIEALFDGIPAGVRLKGDIELPRGEPEQAVFAELRRLAARNVCTEDEVTFLGAGIWRSKISSTEPTPMASSIARRSSEVTAV